MFAKIKARRAEKRNGNNRNAGRTRRTPEEKQAIMKNVMGGASQGLSLLDQTLGIFGKGSGRNNAYVEAYAGTNQLMLPGSDNPNGDPEYMEASNWMDNIYGFFKNANDTTESTSKMGKWLPWAIGGVLLMFGIITATIVSRNSNSKKSK